MFGMNPNKQQNPFMPFGGFPQQGRPPFFPPTQGPPSFFNQQPFNNQKSLPQGQFPFFNNKGSKMGLGNMPTTIGHVMNGYKMLKQIAPMMSFFK